MPIQRTASHRDALQKPSDCSSKKKAPRTAGGYPIEKAAVVDWAWRNREEFERTNPEHPLIHICKAIDKLGNLDVRN